METHLNNKVAVVASSGGVFCSVMAKSLAAIVFDKESLEDTKRKINDKLGSIDFLVNEQGLLQPLNNC